MRVNQYRNTIHAVDPRISLRRDDRSSPSNFSQAVGDMLFGRKQSKQFSFFDLAVDETNPYR